MKDQLIFDTTEVADSDSVGAYIRSDDGTLITHHTVGSDEGLDVYLLNTSIEVTATDLDIRDLVYTQDSITAHQGGTWTIDSITNNVTVDQGTSPWVIGDGGGSITVDALNLDIRDLTAASDSVAAWLSDGAGTALTSTLVGSDQALDVNVVGGLNVEVDLSHIDDSVRLGDGTNFLTSTTVGSDIGLDVYNINDPAVADTAILSSVDTLTVSGTAEKVVASNLAARKKLFVYNKSNQKVYIGGSAVSSSNGFPVSPGSYLELAAGPSVDVYYDGKTGAEIRTLELS